MVGDVATERTTKDQKLAAIRVFAANKRGGPSSTVAVTADEIQGCVGVWRRYAYELIDETAAAIEGTRVREAGDARGGGPPKKKALLVDRDRVHTDAGDVNQFTTGTTGRNARGAGEQSSEVDQ